MSMERKERLAKTNYWNELLAMRDQQRKERKSAVTLVKEQELPLETNSQGLMRWYMHPSISDTVISTYCFFHQEIPPGSRSGKLKFQGGQIMLIIEGKGYTMLDGVKYPWETGDVVNLPLRNNGIVVQHFNSDREKPAKFVAVEPNWFSCLGVDRGSGFEQIEDAPEYRRP